MGPASLSRDLLNWRIVKHYGIIVAAGTGTRFGGNLPKQFQLLSGKPILHYSIELFGQAGAEVILVLPPDRIDFWKELCGRYPLRSAGHVVAGGDTRSASVRNGLRLVKTPGLVAVHDGARPLVSRQLLDTAYYEARRHGSAVPAVELHEALRLLGPNTSEPVDRTRYRSIQTPQCFDADSLIKAYEAVGDQGFPDDATVFEQGGHRVFLFPGERTNIKITTPGDLQVAETLLPGLNV
jgi:2-C-methyl-D-erythritol 4-phosphate cytidylyltransferase